jgi:hypothetical protein
MTHRLAVSLYAALALTLAAFTGSALAGNGHGNGGGNGNGNSGHQTTTPAPAPAPAPAASAPAATSTSAPADKHGKHASTPPTAPTTNDNSTGVKPSNSTQHNTYAKASSNKTKQYGNGKTAGQIAMQNGASSTTNLYGPGNSQPHKAAVCSKNGKTHYVDVHALKNKKAGACTAATTSSSVSTQSSSSVSTQSQSQSQPQTQAGVQSSAGVSSQPSASGGVLGAQARLSKPVTRKAHAAHAVLGTAHFTG